MNIIERIAKELKIPTDKVEKTVELIDDGNAIPFIARYRKEITGDMGDVTLRALEERLGYLRGLEERKSEVIKAICEQGLLTDELKLEIEKAEILQRVEDLYKPFKKKKATRASKARERGLEPLAQLIWEQKLGMAEIFTLAHEYITTEVPSLEEALAGARDILAENISDNPEQTQMIRTKTEVAGQLATEATDKEEKTVYESYYDFSEKISKIPDHRVLAINRGEKEKKLKVKVIAPVEVILESLKKDIIASQDPELVSLLQETIEDSYKRLMAPSMEREIRSKLTERAEVAAVKIFGKNTESLLMVPPVRGARIISIDPGYRTGCKVAVLDETGKLLAYTTVYPTEPRRDVVNTEVTLSKLIDKFNINTIVIGNGTASRETEEVVANFIKKTGRDIKYTIVNEAGASVYSASKIATEEYPDLDVTTRGAMSLGRRLQDPLAELVKVPIKSIGVGQYQHDINQKLLEAALDKVVEDCVNRVGVDLNTASPSLLSHIAGVNSTIAKNIVSYREEVGIFQGRSQLKKVAKLGPKAYEQCAGFMRITGGKNPLDATGVHPESYKIAEEILKRLNIDKSEIGKDCDIELKICQLYGEVEKADLKKDLGKGMKTLAKEIGAGELTLKDIIEEIKKPARDPREDAPPVIFRGDVKSLEDMEIGMELSGTVRNVVDFGAFVDVGVKNDGLVHISQLSNGFVKHPMDVVSVGDTVKVKILEIDKERGKLALTMKS